MLAAAPLAQPVHAVAQLAWRADGSAQEDWEAAEAWVDRVDLEVNLELPVNRVQLLQFAQRCAWPNRSSGHNSVRLSSRIALARESRACLVWLI